MNKKWFSILICLIVGLDISFRLFAVVKENRKTTVEKVIADWGVFDPYEATSVDVIILNTDSIEHTTITLAETQTIGIIDKLLSLNVWENKYMPSSDPNSRADIELYMHFKKEGRLFFRLRLINDGRLTIHEGERGDYKAYFLCDDLFVIQEIAELVGYDAR